MKFSLTSKEYKHLFSNNNSLKIGDLLFRYKKNPLPRLGLIVSKKYGNAPSRNLFKRRCRALYRLYFQNENLIIVIQPLHQNIGWKNIQSGFSKFKTSLTIV